MPPITFFPTLEPTIPHDVQRHLQLLYTKLNNHALAFNRIATQAAAGASGARKTAISAGIGTGTAPPPPTILPSNSIPLPDSVTGASGGNNLYSRSDHVHPLPGTLIVAYTAITGAYTINPATDQQIECTAGTFTVTLPTAVGIPGQVFAVKNSGTGTITLAAASAQTIDGSPLQALDQWDNIVVISNGVGWIIT